MPRPRPSFSEQFRSARRLARLPLRTLADRVSIAHPRLSHLEHGLAPRADEVHKLAQALGAAIAEQIEASGVE